jgi:hypothetical protein
MYDSEGNITNYGDDELTDDDIDRAACNQDDTIFPMELTATCIEGDDDMRFFNVMCRSGCGTFPLTDVDLIESDLENGRATFRCRVCNELQNAEILILD